MHAFAFLFFFAICVTPVHGAHAGSLEGHALGLPLDCTLGKNCWVANYMDMDGSGEARDFQCRRRTYDGHDGTDFAIRDIGAMMQGVPVVASAPGVVKSVREGMPDVAIRDEGSRTRIAGKECGNGIVIEHEGNWETQYCHMRQGSLKVKAGDKVEAGTPLGLVGLSGKTEFPHVHLTVRHEGKAIDPFTGRVMGDGCATSDRKSMWRIPVDYEEVALYNAGFSGGTPNIDAIRGGKQDPQPMSARVIALSFWVDIFGVEAGDRIKLEIMGPDGKPVVEHEQQIEKPQARRFLFAGKKRTLPAWPSGAYKGHVTLSRKAEGKALIHEINRTVMVE